MNDEPTGNEWLDELRSEEIQASPRPGFKAELRNRIGAEWDGRLDDASTDTRGDPTSAIDKRPTPAPVKAPAAPRSTTYQTGSATNIAWPRFAAAAAVVALVIGGIVLLSQSRGRPDQIAVTANTTVASTESIPTSSAPASLATSSAPKTSPATEPTTTVSVPEATEPTNPQTTIDGSQPGTSSSTPATPDVPSLLADWPTAPAPDPPPSMDNFQHYLPAEPIPGETEVLKTAASDEAYVVADPVYVESYAVGSGIVNVVTMPGPPEFGVPESSGETIATTDWANQWPDSYYAAASEGATTIVLSAPSGAVVVTGVGLDRAGVTAFASGLTRRPAPAPGWTPATEVTTISEGWQYQWGYVRTLFLSDPDTPMTQLDVFNQRYSTFPWTDPYASVQTVDIGGHPAVISSSGGVVIVSWITADGQGLRLAHTGSWEDTVAIARTIEPVSLEVWGQRVDGVENLSGAVVDCFAVICDG